MEINTDFSDIRPYRDHELDDVIKRTLEGHYLRKIMRELAFPKASRVMIPILERITQLYAWLKLRNIHSINEFQKKIIIDIGLGYMRKISIDEITWDGIDQMQKGESYIYVSNHRDIAVDPAMTNYVLDQVGLPTTEIAFGDNLMKNQFISDIIRVNKAFIVKRDLPIREQIKESLKLSAYIQDTVNRKESIWIAQDAGRAKDGKDVTNPALIKMMYYSLRKQKVSFEDFLKKVNIVPLVISYEYDPCDRLKAWELRRKALQGEHVKGTHEDMTSLYAGIKGWKGRVHLSFGSPIKTGENVKEVAALIDHHVYSNYKFWPNNYIAYDEVMNSVKYADLYSMDEKKKFLSRYKYMSPEVRTIALQIYANPVLQNESIR